MAWQTKGQLTPPSPFDEVQPAAATAISPAVSRWHYVVEEPHSTKSQGISQSWGAQQTPESQLKAKNNNLIALAAQIHKFVESRNGFVKNLQKQHSFSLEAW